MSDADGPTKDTSISSRKTESRIDTAASSSPDVDVTLDTAGTPDSGVSVADHAVLEPRFIGSYQLIKKLGEGGMGQVWLAEQTAPVRRPVALKLIKVGVYDDSVLQRFQSERQSLAIMDHPSIAKVFDAGATPDGQPYFVMEFVPGLPITNYCDEKRLSIRERLELFIKVCEGVQHAHQKAIIHRDLKPANILVVEVDGRPTPRIIDFGLAKAAIPRIVGETTFTQAGGFVGTPGYVSPEQADPNVQDVDTRTDVYSLGVVLYVLLTGLQPFDPKEWQKQPYYEILRQLREEDPPSPSDKLHSEAKSNAETVTATAEMRGTEPKRLAHLVHGDLDWITMKALERDRARRYGTPSELAADIGRHLHNDPITARPASTRYRLQKYVRRHRVGVAAVSGLAMLLGAFAVAQAMQLRRITRERDRANRITDFMTGMFKVSDPSEARGNKITAREILDKASKDIDTGLARDPAMQAQMMHVMGMVYQGLGLYPKAESLLAHAAEIRRRVLGPNNREALSSQSRLGWILQLEGRRAESEKLCRATLEAQRRALGSDDPDTLRSISDLAVILADRGDYAEAEKLFRETLDAKRRVLGPEHRDTLVAMSNLAVTLYIESRYSEAETLQRETLELRRRVLGPDHPDTLASMQNLAAVLDDEGRYSEAETWERNTIEILRRVLGSEHLQTLLGMENLAETLQREHRYGEAEELQRETLKIRRRVLGPEHQDTLRSISELADSLAHEGSYAEAEDLLGKARDTQRRVLGPDHPDAASSTYILSRILALKGQTDQALSLLREAVEHGLSPTDDLDIEKSSDFKSLHDDPRFAALVAHAKERAAAAQKPH